MVKSSLQTLLFKCVSPRKGASCYYREPLGDALVPDAPQQRARRDPHSQYYSSALVPAPRLPPPDPHRSHAETRRYWPGWSPYCARHPKNLPQRPAGGRFHPVGGSHTLPRPAPPSREHAQPIHPSSRSRRAPEAKQRSPRERSSRGSQYRAKMSKPTHVPLIEYSTYRVFYHCTAAP